MSLFHPHIKNGNYIFNSLGVAALALSLAIAIASTARALPTHAPGGSYPGHLGLSPHFIRCTAISARSSAGLIPIETNKVSIGYFGNSLSSGVPNAFGPSKVRMIYIGLGSKLNSSITIFKALAARSPFITSGSTSFPATPHENIVTPSSISRGSHGIVFSKIFTFHPTLQRPPEIYLPSRLGSISLTTYMQTVVFGCSSNIGSVFGPVQNRLGREYFCISKIVLSESMTCLFSSAALCSALPARSVASDAASIAVAARSLALATRSDASFEALRPKWISAYTPRATSASAIIGPHSSRNDLWVRNLKASATSIIKPAKTAIAPSSARPSLVEICSLKMSLIFIYPRKSNRKGVHPIFGAIAGLLICGLLALFDWVFR